MGNKVHKPVVTAAEAESNISTEDFARYQRFFLAGTGGRDVGLKKEEFVSKVWLREFGGALLWPRFMIALPSPIHHLTLMIMMITMMLLPPLLPTLNASFISRHMHHRFARNCNF